MWWMVSLLLIGVLGRALAQESPAGSEQMEAEEARRASDRAIVRFNTDIKDFPSWELFEVVVLTRVVPGMMGTCYAYQGGMVHVTTELLPRAERATRWQKTAGKGWQQTQTDRTSIEYRLNEKAGVLLWTEGVSPRFFFASTRKICELPLGAIRY
jgi:hypothetical protein